MRLNRDELYKIANRLGLKVWQDATSTELITNIHTKVRAAPLCVKKATGNKGRCQENAKTSVTKEKGQMPFYQSGHSPKNASLETLQQNMIYLTE